MTLLQDNAQLISALASIGMLLLWSTYAWLFYREFRQRRSASLFIHSAGGGELSSVCMLVNLSPAPIHVICSMATREGKTARLRDLSEVSSSVTARAKQGPVGAGDSLCLGSFEEIRSQLDRIGGSDASEQTIEIRVAVIHASHPAPIGACRRFRMNVKRESICSEMLATQQMQSRRQVREVMRWLEHCRDGE